MGANANHLQVIENQQPAQVQNVGMITPVGTIEQAIEQFKLYQQLKNMIGTKDDFQKIGDKQHPKKSFVRKIQRFFNVSCEIIQDEPLRDQDGNIIAWLARARAIHHQTGAYQEADGSCGFDEKVDKYGNPDKKRQTIHNIRAHAITRAKNRAILDLVGFGEVSAEEINEREYVDEQQQRSQQQANNAQTLATEKQIKAIHATANEKNISDEELKALYAKVGKSSAKELTRKEASQLIDYLKSRPKQEQTQQENFEDVYKSFEKRELAGGR